MALIVLGDRLATSALSAPPSEAPMWTRPDQSTITLGVTITLWVFAGATRTRPQTIVRPTHSRTRAKLTGPGHVHRKHLHRSKHACRCVLWCR